MKAEDVGFGKWYWPKPKAWKTPVRPRYAVPDMTDIIVWGDHSADTQMRTTDFAELILRAMTYDELRTYIQWNGLP